METLSNHPWTVYGIPGLDFDIAVASQDHPGELSASQFWMLNRHGWDIEQLLISAVSRELSGNSAYGGFTNLRFKLTRDEGVIFGKVSESRRKPIHPILQADGTALTDPTTGTEFV